mgnify:CR=1 FL=1
MALCFFIFIPLRQSGRFHIQIRSHFSTSSPEFQHPPHPRITIFSCRQSPRIQNWNNIENCANFLCKAFSFSIFFGIFLKETVIFKRDSAKLCLRRKNRKTAPNITEVFCPGNGSGRKRREKDYEEQSDQRSPG